jgi:hypothetical protein
MIGAMVVLLLFIAGYVAFRALIRQAPPSPVHAVSYRPEAAYARKQASFDLLAPAALPAGWRATTVSFTPAPKQHWHLGILTDKGRYVGLEQGKQPVSDMVKVYVDKAARRGAPVTVAGRRWQTWRDGSGDLALVSTLGRATTLVVGHDVPEPQVTAFAASLR